MFASVAQYERELTSDRTVKALAAKKARGEKTGGASEAWLESYKRKSNEQKKEESMKRGITKNLRNIESKDVQVFIKVLRNVFPLATSAKNPNDWDWSSITTKDGYRQSVLSMMRDYRDIDPTLFTKWVFDDLDGRDLQVKLASYIQRVKKAFMYNNYL